MLWGEVAAAAAGHGFIAKADISSIVIASLASTRDSTDRILTLPQSGPRHDDERPASTRYGNLRSAIPQQIGERDNEGITFITDNLCVAFASDGIRVNERVIGDLQERAYAP